MLGRCSCAQRRQRNLGSRWWAVALAIQFSHHSGMRCCRPRRLGTHLLWFTVPTSVAQLWFPPSSSTFLQHIVFVPMMVAMYFHMFPPAQSRARSAAARGKRARSTPSCLAAVSCRARAAIRTRSDRVRVAGHRRVRRLVGGVDSGRCRCTRPIAADHGPCWPSRQHGPSAWPDLAGDDRRGALRWADPLQEWAATDAGRQLTMPAARLTREQRIESGVLLALRAGSPCNSSCSHAPSSWSPMALTGAGAPRTGDGLTGSTTGLL